VRAPARGRQKSPLRGLSDCRWGEDTPHAPRAFADPLAYLSQTVNSSLQQNEMRSSRSQSTTSEGTSDFASASSFVAQRAKKAADLRNPQTRFPTIGRRRCRGSRRTRHPGTHQRNQATA
jgi:hypothetical protein